MQLNSLRGLKVYTPIILVQIYLIGTIILYSFGPLQWDTNNKVNFYILIFLYQFSLLFGYISGVKIKNTRKSINIEKKKLEKYLTICLILNIIITLLMTVRLSGMNNISIAELYENFINGITNPEVQYNSKFNSVIYGGKLLTYCSVILSPITWTSIPLGLYYFKKISPKIDILLISAIVFEVMHWIIRGTNKGLFDLLIMIISIQMLKTMRVKNKKRINLKSKIIIFLCVYFVLSFFIKNIMGRIGGNISILSQINGGTTIDTNKGLLLYLPSWINTLLILLSSYLTQGYYAMSMAINIPHTPMFGVGHSIFLIENIKELIGVDLFKYTYQFKLEDFGWDSRVNWHTLYMWIANDVNFIGVVLVMFLLGYLFAVLVKDFMKNESEISICLLVLFTIMFIYIPANNQIGTSPYTAISFLVLMILWFVKKYNIKVK